MTGHAAPVAQGTQVGGFWVYEEDAQVTITTLGCLRQAAPGRPALLAVGLSNRQVHVYRCSEGAANIIDYRIFRKLLPGKRGWPISVGSWSVDGRQVIAAIADSNPPRLWVWDINERPIRDVPIQGPDVLQDCLVVGMSLGGCALGSGRAVFDVQADYDAGHDPVEIITSHPIACLARCSDANQTVVYGSSLAEGLFTPSDDADCSELRGCGGDAVTVLRAFSHGDQPSAAGMTWSGKLVYRLANAGDDMASPDEWKVWSPRSSTQAKSLSVVLLQDRQRLLSADSTGHVQWWFCPTGQSTFAQHETWTSKPLRLIFHSSDVAPRDWNDTMLETLGGDCIAFARNGGRWVGFWKAPSVDTLERH